MTQQKMTFMKFDAFSSVMKGGDRCFAAIVYEFQKIIIKFCTLPFQILSYNIELSWHTKISSIHKRQFPRKMCDYFSFSNTILGGTLLPVHAITDLKTTTTLPDMYTFIWEKQTLKKATYAWTLISRGVVIWSEPDQINDLDQVLIGIWRTFLVIGWSRSDRFFHNSKI